MMDQSHIELSASLEQMRLPQLQERFQEVVGEPTRAPNKKYLIRRIVETLEQQATDRAQEEARIEVENAAGTAQPEDEDVPATSVKLSMLSVAALQERYRQVVGRDTGSSNKRYLIWKIGQAQKGNIPIGAIQRTHRQGPGPAMKVLPVRLETALVAAIDDARKRLGLKSRMALFRHALGDYLARAGEEDVAQRIEATL